MFDKNTVLTPVAIIVRENKGKQEWLLIKKSSDDDWEFPRMLVRKTESSVRATIRMAGEQFGMTGQVIEEVGRSGGVTTLNGKTFSQRQLYYLMYVRDQSGEVMGFAEYEFLEFPKASRRLTQKRERTTLKNAREEFRKWKAEKKDQEEELLN